MSSTQLPPKQLMSIFRRFIKDAEELLDRKMKGAPRKIRYMERSPDFTRPNLGVVSGEVEVAIPKADAFLVRGLLAVEAFKRLLPASISELPQALDLAWTYAYSQFGKTERKKWKEIWLKVAQPIDLGDIIHYPVEAFTLLEEMRPRRGLAELIALFYEMDRYHETVGRDEFVRLVEDFFTHYQVELSEREVRVLDAVTRNPEFTLDELSERTRLSTRTVSATVSSLKRRGILFLRDSIGFYRLGFTAHYLYLVPRRSTKEEVLETLRHYPYLFNLGELIDGQGGCLATIFLPYWLDNETELEKLRGLLKPLCQPDRYLSFTRVRGHSHRSFRHYSLSENDWRVPWQSWALWLKRVLAQPELASITEFTTNPHSGNEESPARLDRLDWAIIKEVWDGESRARQLRQKLGIGSNLLQERLQRLREEGAIITRVGVLCVGLSEPTFLLIHGEPTELWALIAALDELPFHMTVEVEGDVTGLFSVLYLPRGQGPAFAAQIHKHLPNHQIQIHLARRIPLSYFDLPLPP